MTYEGFCIDLLNEISSQLGFKYEIRVSPKNEYGNCNDEGECNGMVKELVERVSTKPLIMAEGVKWNGEKCI